MQLFFSKTLKFGEKMRKIALVFLVFTGCSAVQKNVSSEYLADYRSKESLGSSLLDKDGNLGEPEIQKLLQSKVEFPKKIHIAIALISESSSFRPQVVSRELEDLYKIESWGSRVVAVTPLPQLLLGEKISLKSLRQSAALLQADALVVIKPISRADWRFQFFSATEAKATSFTEILLLDTRTSVVPFTSLISESVEIEEGGDDFSKGELLERARMKSEALAQKKIPEQIATYLEGAL
jgi:hypothetical protein